MATTDPQNVAPGTPPVSDPTPAKAGTYEVISPLWHDGVLYGTGDRVALRKGQAQALLDAGAILKPDKS